MHTTQVNRCVENLTGDTSWRGLVIAFAKNPENEPVDMKASALNKIFDGLGDVLGVRINYDRLVTLRNAPRFETVAIKSWNFRGEGDNCCWLQPRGRRNASLFTQHTGIVLQDRQELYLGHPLLVRTNSISRLLLIPCDISKHNFGYIEQQFDTGNVVVVREDRKPLDVQYVEILCDWISTDLLPLFRQAMSGCLRLNRPRARGNATTRMTEQLAIRQRVLDRITKQNLLAFSRGRLRDEDAGVREDPNMAEIIEDHDTTGNKMPEDSKVSETSDSGVDIPSNERSEVQNSGKEE